MPPSAMTVPSCNTTTRRAIDRTKAISCSDHYDRVSRRRAKAEARRCARSPAASCPRPARPPEAVSDSASVACRFRADCFCPCERTLPNASRCPESLMMLRTSSILICCWGEIRACRVFQNVRMPANASSRFSNTVSCSKTSTASETSRPIPDATIWASDNLEQIDAASKPGSSGVRARLARITSIMVVLPAPLGPMMHSNPPGSTCSVKFAECLEAVEANGQVLKIKSLVVVALIVSMAGLHRPAPPSARQAFRPVFPRACLYRAP